MLRRLFLFGNLIADIIQPLYFFVREAPAQGSGILQSVDGRFYPGDRHRAFADDPVQRHLRGGFAGMVRPNFVQ